MPKWRYSISIQALYDYKKLSKLSWLGSVSISIQALYDYKAAPELLEALIKMISIQALYDYKSIRFSSSYTRALIFQFKHCTIIRWQSG